MYVCVCLTVSDLTCRCKFKKHIYVCGSLYITTLYHILSTSILPQIYY